MRLPAPYRPEADVLSERLARLSHPTPALDWASVVARAAPWVQAVRDHPPPFWAMESLLKEYPISSAEGLALMRLAEALLRVPDADTAMALTADQLARADFGAHADDHTALSDGLSRSALARLSSTAIALSKKFLPEPHQPDATPPNLLVRLGARTVVAATLRSVQLLGRQFVLGQTMTEAQQVAAHSRKRQPSLCFSYDMLGEGARTEADALRHEHSYQAAIAAIAQARQAQASVEASDGISIKLSALHPRYEALQTQRVMDELLPRVWSLCEQAARANLNLTIDAEEVDRLELSLDVFEALAARVAQHHPQWQGFGLALQAYQTRAVELIEHVIAIARHHGLRLMCRLVKGAYWDAEIKRAQELGLPHYPVFTEKHHTDVSYLACARTLLDAPDAIYPQFATHNAGTIAALMQMAQGRSFELQRLHGMGEGVYREVLRQHPQQPCRVYAPVGQHRDLLAYLVRRLLENGANSSFVHQLADESVGLDVLLASPMVRASAFAQGQADASQVLLPLPPQIYGPQRPNSLGLDVSVASDRALLDVAWANAALPNVQEFDIQHLNQAFTTCVSSYQEWSNRPVAERAHILRRAADALQADLPRFCALLVQEAHKTWGDAMAEVREAIDFLRYYALQAERIQQPIDLPEVPAEVRVPTGFKGWGVTGERNTLQLRGRGVWVAISPWNFPLAIFVGQVAAALVTGNTVLAKPAEQTPAVAQAAVALLHDAGVPTPALQLLHGPGETVGAGLVALPGVAGVVFTGSTQVAKLIQRALAAKDGPIVPLIAETGGINAMLVDSSALPEQVCDAVVQSAFRSAGQRCSALRVLCVHEAVADGVIDMIQGAMQELRVGDPRDFATDVGPLIDDDAHAHISRLVKNIKQKSVKSVKSVITQINQAQAAIKNTFPPQLIEVSDATQVGEEVFGPVLQVLRWGPSCAGLETPQALVAAINRLGAAPHSGESAGSAGYGLTLGLHTRIDSRALAWAQAAHVGNVYVNRNMIGAVVGLQPFGGDGLSGTGPKAGGPHYLYRFCTEQTLTINTTAAGGNVALMA